MSIGGGAGRRPSKNERRDAAREKARQLRQQQQRRERRTRVLIQGGVIVVILAVVAVVALVLVNSIAPSGPGPKNMADNGIVITKGLVADRTGSGSATDPAQRLPQQGKVAIRTYEDFQCPICKGFETANAAQIKALVQAGKATLQIYPVSILDRESQGTRYSSRAANAAACVANFSPDDFYAFHGLLYAHQPAEGGTGLTDAQLISYAKQSGASSMSSITTCIQKERYKGWVTDSTDTWLKGHLPDSNVGAPDQYYGTPIVLVNGKQYTGSTTDATAFANFILASAAEYTATPTPTTSGSATPTPSPTPSK